ncbi:MULTISPECIES: YfbM family protein [Kitasatospora]|uniref:YfbM family protein n=1 Tax=Kitasatospora TaxID=2063 RepID=UPI000C711E7A|nr:YfbM family protein [Kitasatospora sp. GP30]
MSILGIYARLAPAELARAIGDPRWESIEEIISAETDEPDAAQPRRLDIDRAWDILRHLLERLDLPITIIFGEEEIPGANAEDWGYGPPRYLTPEQVRTSAATLAATPSVKLIEGVTAAELVQAELYSVVGEDEAERWLTAIVHTYQALARFFESAAHSGDAIVVWFS